MRPSASCRPPAASRSVGLLTVDQQFGLPTRPAARGRASAQESKASTPLDRRWSACRECRPGRSGGKGLVSPLPSGEGSRRLARSSPRCLSSQKHRPRCADTSHSGGGGNPTNPLNCGFGSRQLRTVRTYRYPRIAFRVASLISSGGKSEALRQVDRAVHVDDESSVIDGILRDLP